MKVAIHNREESFSQRWIAFCEKKKIPFKIVNCYSSEIVSELEDCDIVLWHFHHSDYRDKLFAKQLLFSLEQSGKLIFPNSKTMWYFDDKLGQKFLLESLNLPHVKTDVFYDKKSALDRIEDSEFPKVFKLRNGAGSSNVRLVKNKIAARKLVNRAFSRGFSAFEGRRYFAARFKKYKNGLLSFSQLLRSSLRLFIKRKSSKLMSPEMGYVYFQEFFPKQEGDIRIIVIGDKAFGIKRLILGNDFRASGSGKTLYDKKYFSTETIALAFKTSEKLNAQVCAIDFIYKNSEPYIVEISYGFTQKVYDACEGYWNRNLEWIGESFNPQEWIIENVINQYDCQNHQ